MNTLVSERITNSTVKWYNRVTKSGHTLFLRAEELSWDFKIVNAWRSLSHSILKYKNKYDTEPTLTTTHPHYCLPLSIDRSTTKFTTFEPLFCRDALLRSFLRSVPQMLAHPTRTQNKPFISQHFRIQLPHIHIAKPHVYTCHFLLHQKPGEHEQIAHPP